MSTLDVGGAYGNHDDRFLNKNKKNEEKQKTEGEQTIRIKLKKKENKETPENAVVLKRKPANSE